MQIPDHVLVFDARGTLQKSDIERFDRQIQEKLARYQQIGVIANVEQLGGMTLGAVMKDIAAELKYLGDWHRLPRLAVLASGGFVKSAAEVVGKLLPQIQVRTFDPGDWSRRSSLQARSTPGKRERPASRRKQAEEDSKSGIVSSGRLILVASQDCPAVIKALRGFFL